MPRVGDLVIINKISHRREEVGQVVHQTDIMSEVATASGLVRVRTKDLTVVQPGHLEGNTHTGVWRQHGQQ